MARIISLIVLVGILLVIGGLFLKVMAGFLLPLFLAALLVVVFRPLHRWFVGRCGRYSRIAALLTTLAILLLVLIPLSLLLVEAGYEAQGLYRAAMGRPNASAGAVAEQRPAEDSPLSEVAKLSSWMTSQFAKAGHRLGIAIDTADIQERIALAVQDFLAPLALRTTRFLADTLFSFLIMLLATYYFFADGPAMLDSLMRLSPVENHRMRELVEQFDSITRAVVAATLISAFVQGLLAGIGFYFAGVGSVFLLTALCMLFTLVPFVGAAIVWVPVCLWLFAVEGRTMPAVLLAVYCMGVVSTVDNLVKPYVLQGRSNLHPLLALLSVLGGVQALGPIGILVGPMVVAFLQTLLNIVQSELAGVCSEQETLRNTDP